MVKRKTKTKAQKSKSKNKFQQKRTQKINTQKNAEMAFFAQMQEQQAIITRCNILEQVYKAKPELGVEIDGVLQINKEAVEIKEDGILYWTKDNNPIISGLDQLENYPKYSEMLVNEVLKVIQKQNEAPTEDVMDIDVDDFELIEDADFEEVGVDSEADTEEVKV